MHYTTTQAAEEVADRLAIGPGRPSIYKGKISTLVDARRLTDTTAASGRTHIHRSEIDDFVARTRFVPNPAHLLALNPRIFRVSVTPREPNEVRHAHTGRVLRADKGVDYTLDPASAGALGGWEGVWPLRQRDLGDLCDHQGLLLATCRGYVGPGYIRTVVGHSPVEASSRRYLHTAPAPAEVQDFLGTGIWVDTHIGGGGISGFIRP